MTPAPASPRAPRTRMILRLVLLGVALTAFVFVLRWVKGTGLLDQALRWVQSLGPWAPLVFILLYVGTVVVCFPAAILTAGAGFIFGFSEGSVHVMIAATIAANVNFLLSRHLARDWIARKLGGHPRFQAIDEAVAAEGWKMVALVRLAPVFPFSITSYACGLTRVPMWEYFLANFAMIPATLLYVYLGSLTRDLTEKVTTPLWIKGTILACSLITVIYVTRVARRALGRRIS